MVSGDLHILPTHNRPEFLFNPSGVFYIKGRALLVNEDESTNQIWSWLDGYLGHPARTTYVNIEFEYLNSFSTLLLVNILKKLSRAIPKPGNLMIKWHYEEDDDEIIERGQAISSIISCPIEFILINSAI